jgi:enoyl-CoA hydratase
LRQIRRKGKSSAEPTQGGGPVERVRSTRAGRTAIVALADPGRRNAITTELAQQLGAALAEIAEDDTVRAVVLTGEGTAFCAGGDRDALRRADEVVLRGVYDAFLRVRNLPLPTVAAVNGPAVGAGLNLALACDVRIAAESAVFDSRFVHLPIHPGGGHAWMLERLVGPQAAAAITLFGHPVDGPRALELGLAWACVPDERLIDATLEFCAGIEAAPTALLREVKDTLRTTPTLQDHATACEAELVRQLASVARPEYGERFAVAR